MQTLKRVYVGKEDRDAIYALLSRKPGSLTARETTFLTSIKAVHSITEKEKAMLDEMWAQYGIRNSASMEVEA